MAYTQIEMAFLAEVPPACAGRERPPAAAEGKPQTALADAGPQPCVSRDIAALCPYCKGPGLYLMGGYVLCEKHLRDSVRSAMSATKEARERHPHVLYCADGFNTVERRGRQDHRALGPWQRVQVCACKAVFPVHWLWTGEPLLCPQCAAAAFREVYPPKTTEYE